VILAVSHGGLGGEMVNQQARGPAAIVFDVVQRHQTRSAILLGEAVQCVETLLLDRRGVERREIVDDND
jgi:hypothetical protein